MQAGITTEVISIPLLIVEYCQTKLYTDLLRDIILNVNTTYSLD